ncbi:MAG: hypothetical protein QNJ94_04225 [Alphaproteobacteria bacterium]|nr:hypothetical protein [Alphaproteobacteria bacterium]
MAIRHFLGRIGGFALQCLVLGIGSLLAMPYLLMLLVPFLDL